MERLPQPCLEWQKILPFVGSGGLLSTRCMLTDDVYMACGLFARFASVSVIIAGCALQLVQRLSARPPDWRMDVEAARLRLDMTVHCWLVCMDGKCDPWWGLVHG